MGVAALAAAKGDRNDLPAFRVVRRNHLNRHADEFVFNERFAIVEFERLWDDRSQLCRISAVCNDQIFAVDEPIWTRQ